MNNSKMASIVRQRVKKMTELAQPIFQKSELNRSLYAGLLNVDDTYEWDYSLTDPHVFPLLRNYMARSNPSQTKIRLEARKASDYEKRQVNQDFLNWEMNEMMTTSLFYKMYFSGYMNGWGFAKTGWKYEPKILIEGDGGKQIVMREILNRADAKFVRFNDLLVPNQNIPNLDDQPYLAELVQMRVGDMLDDNEDEEYWDKKWLEELKKTGAEKQLLDYQMDFVDDDSMDKEVAFRSAYVSLICMHTKDGELFYIPYKGDDTVVNKNTTNPYWHGHYPYIGFCPFPEDDNFYSQSLVNTVGDLQIAATEVLNQTMTNIRQINSDMWIAGTPASQTPDWQFTKRPNGIIRVAGDVTQIQQVSQKDNTMQALKVSEAIQTKIERTGGISSLYSSGAPSQNINQTARGAQIIDQNIDNNMRMLIDLFGEQVIKKMGEHFIELNAQYVTEEQTFFVTGKKNVRSLVTIDPAMVTANFDVYVNAERMIKQTPASRQASLQNLMTILGQEAQKNGVLTDITPVVEALIDSYPEMDNVDDVVVSIDEKSNRDIAMLMRTQQVQVKVKDPHMELMQYARMYLEDHLEEIQGLPEGMGEEVLAAFGKYLTDHTRFMQSQAEIKAMLAPPPLMGGTDNPQAGVPGATSNLQPITGAQ